MKTTDNILFVNDEENVLHAIKRQLTGKCDVITAGSGADGLELLEMGKDIAVVISDLRMPEMDGIQFLTAVKERYPTCIRAMLSGHADLQTAIEAVNEGNVFRFITKPCPPEKLYKILEACCTQYYLLQTGRELLEKTLRSAIKVIVGILSLTNPVAFSRTLRIKHFC